MKRKPVAIAFVLAGFLFIYAVALHAADLPVSRFVVVTGSQTVSRGAISDPITIQAQNESGAATTVDETIDLFFTSASATGEFLNASGDPIKTVMNKGTANRTFYYRDTTPGTYTLTIKATGRTSGKSWTAGQNISIGTGNPPAMASSSATPLSATSSGASAISSAVIALPPAPSIRAFAGDDRVAFVGVEENFIGGAMGLLGSPITDARFWWNFGDGGTAEGKSVGHTYRETGTYTAVLSVTSGGYAATDYTQIRVEPNKISLAGVTAGEVGGIRIANPASAGADIGGWALEDDRGRVFFLPVHTVIGPGGEAVFANKITGLDPRTKVTLRYPGGQAATIWESQTVSGATQVEVGTPLFIPTQAGSGDGRVSFVADTAVRFATARHGAAAGTVLSAGAVASSSESAPRDSGSGGTEGSHLSRIFFAAASAGSFIAAACFFIIRRMID